MKTTTRIAFLLAATFAVHTYGGDAKVTLDSANGSSAFIVRDSASNELARVQSDGKVGIGTTTPYTTLTVGSTDATAKITAGGPNTHLTLASAGPAGSIYLNAGGVESGNYSTSTRLTILPEGRVGIGTTTPAYKLDVSGSINGSAITINGTPVATSHDTYWSTAGGGAIQYSGGNVGIGKTTPAYPLDVLGDINLSGSLRLNGTASLTAAKAANWDAAFGWGDHALAGYLTAFTETDPLFAASAAHGIAAGDLTAWNAKVGGSGTVNYVPKFTASGTVSTSAIYSAADGNVGIGTTSPQAKLQVDGRVIINHAAAPGFYGQSAGTNKVYLGYDGAGTGLELYNFTSGKSLMIRDNGDLTYPGNVGIGTTTPADLLQVGNLMFGGNSGREIYSTSGYDINYKATGASSHHFYAFGTEKFTIDKTGNIGIGINSPNNKLQIGSTTYSENTLAMGNGTQNFAIDVSWSTIPTFYSDNNFSFMASGGGNGRVGIGTTTPAYTLHVNGSVAGTSAYNNLSDARLKKDVQPINDALAIVGALRGVTFNWDQTVDPLMKLDDRNHVGFLAQEVEAVLPQAVSTASDARQTKSVAYSEVIPVLVEALKQQQAQIDVLKAEVEALKTK
jgi:hypothetical protein